MPRLNEAERLRAVGILEAGMTQVDVAMRLGVHFNTVYRLWRRYQQSNSVRDRPRSGRPRVTSRRQDNFIRTTHVRNRFQPASVTSRSIPRLRRISPRTVRNRLREARIRPRRPAIRPVSLRRHRVARLAWCRRHLRYTNRDWQRVLFTDESRFLLDSYDGRIRVCRGAGERFNNGCVIERRQMGGGSVMIWGGITTRARTPLVFIEGNLSGQRYRDEVVRPHVIPFIRNANQVITFQQDNARPHTAGIVRDFLRQNNVPTLDWPAVSPDLSPIEHLWDEIERRLRRVPNAPTTFAELRQALQNIWQKFLCNFYAIWLHQSAADA